MGRRGGGEGRCHYYIVPPSWPMRGDICRATVHRSKKKWSSSVFGCLRKKYFVHLFVVYYVYFFMPFVLRVSLIRALSQYIACVPRNKHVRVLTVIHNLYLSLYVYIRELRSEEKKWIFVSCWRVYIMETK